MEGEEFRVVTEAMNAMRVMKTEDECVMNPQAVLSFWFDGNLDHNYKTKWFPTSSRSLQQQADETITTRFLRYLQAALNHELDHWLDDTSSTIALIIVLDQFSRHIYRQMNLPAEAKERVLTDQLALSITEKFIASTSSASSTKDLQIDQFVFSLMPFRHSATVERLQFVLNSIDQKIATQEKYSDLLNKFRKQTLRRLQHLQDRSAVRPSHPLPSPSSSISSRSFLSLSLWGRPKKLAISLNIMSSRVMKLTSYPILSSRVPNNSSRNTFRSNARDTLTEVLWSPSPSLEVYPLSFSSLSSLSPLLLV
jgi:uncharacterized protein (DUF924 family)